jgi:hypothetical protein
MNDPSEQEPIVGHDPTNGLAGDLEGDDGGSVEPTAEQNVIQEVVRDLDPDRTDSTGDDDAVTPYSEEGAP